MFRRKKFQQLNKDEMQQLLDYVKATCVNIYFRAKEAKENILQNAYIVDKKTCLEVTIKVASKACTYKFNYCNEEPKHFKTGLDAFAVFSRYAKVQRYEGDCSTVGSATAILYKNPRFSGKRVKAYSYDLNSAYAYMLLQDIPNIDTLKRYTYLKKGQIGFIEMPTGLEITFKNGIYCDYVCDLMPSPYERFVHTWYDRKRNATTHKEKANAKDMLNFPVGYCQNINPFLRATIVGRCNLFIKNLMDENTIYCNTDSIVSLARRPDLEQNLGDELGQWKFERKGQMFAWEKEKVNYQWNLETPVARGIPKYWFKTFEKINGRKFDILEDRFPTFGNIYRLNTARLRIERIKYEKA